MTTESISEKSQGKGTNWEKSGSRQQRRQYALTVRSGRGSQQGEAAPVIPESGLFPQHCAF